MRDYKIEPDIHFIDRGEEERNFIPQDEGDEEE